MLSGLQRNLNGFSTSLESQALIWYSTSMKFFTEDLIQSAKRWPKTHHSYLTPLCLGEGQNWKGARSQIELWLDRFPLGRKRHQIIRDLSSFGGSHLGAFFELATYSLFRELHLEVEPNDTEEQNPDFFLKLGGQSETFCLEVTSIQPDREEISRQNSLNVLCAAIENRSPRSCFLNVFVFEARRVLEARDIKRISLEVERQLSEINDLRDLPRRHAICSATAPGFRAEARYQRPRQRGCSVGFTTGRHGRSSVQQQKLVADKIRQKVRRHKQVHPESPLLVVLGCCPVSTDTFLPEYMGFNALYGPERIFVPVSQDGESGEAYSEIDPELGLVTPTHLDTGLVRGPRNTSLTGVFDLLRLPDSKASLLSARYTPNVFARTPVFEISERIPSCVRRAWCELPTRQIVIENLDATEYYNSFVT